MVHDPEECEKERRALQQAFNSLLMLVEALAAISEQEENAVFAAESTVAPLTVTTAGRSLATITKQILGCRYVGVFALDPPDERQRLLGVSGLTSDQERHLQAETDQLPLAEYLDATAIAQLHANQVVTRDLHQHPFVTFRSTYGARYRLVAPMILAGHLMGLFTMAKTDEVFSDVQSAFPQEERALARGIAKLAAQLIERVQDHANEWLLQEMNRQYHDFLAIASHELRNPLATIKGNAQLLLRRIGALTRHGVPKPSLQEDVQGVRDRLDYVVQNANKLERIIGELMDVSRIQSGQLVMTMQPCDLREIVRLAVEDSRHVAEDRTFLLALPEEAIPILADADRIAQVVQNYLSNAVKYSPVTSPIEVRIQREGARVRVSVRDEGPGLALEEQTRIWERFYRVPGVNVIETSHAEANLGLGLHVCKKIIESHHGQVGVHSISGQGSTFWFLVDLLPSGALSRAT